MKKRTIILISLICLAVLIFCRASFHSEDENAGAIRTLSEHSYADWVKTVEQDCGLKAFGRPFGTARETLVQRDGLWKITFELDENITPLLLTGYVQSVWDACVLANGGRVKSGSGFLYDRPDQAMKLQEPFPYYIWYYSVNQVQYRVGIFPSTMEEGIGGGIVLKISERVL